MSPTPAPSAPPSGSPVANIPPGWNEHDINARQVVRRYLGKIAPALKGVYGDAAFAKLADILAAAENYPELAAVPEFAQVTQGNTEIKPKVVNGVKVFELTIDEIDHKIDASRHRSRRSATTRSGPAPSCA